MTSITVERFKHEELINVLTHIPGIILGVVFFFILVPKFPSSSIFEIVAYCLYIGTFLSVYTASTIYHGTKNSDYKQFLKKIDHACIYLFIGGCYSPFVIINMADNIKYWFFALVWILVCFGVIYKFLSKYKSTVLSLIFYFSLSFMCFLAKGPLLDKLPSETFKYLAYGGVLYTVGAFFYAVKRIPYHHAIWHILVLLASSCHFYAVYYTYKL